MNLDNNIIIASSFKKGYRRVIKQGKDKNKLIEVLNKLVNHKVLDDKYKNHKLYDDGKYKDCMECHIEPDWVLVYRYDKNNLILILIATGSHSDLF